MTLYLPVVQVLPNSPLHTHTVIVLHPQGLTAQKCAAELFKYKTSDNRNLRKIFPTFRWVFPMAAPRPFTPPAIESTQWFDMTHPLYPEEVEDAQVEGFADNIGLIRQIIADERRLLYRQGHENDAEHIILVGSGQGCAMAIMTLLYRGVKLGGFIGLSGWLPFHDQISINFENTLQEIAAQMQWVMLQWGSNRLSESTDARVIRLVGDRDSPLHTPIFITHSENNKVVPFALGVKLAVGLHRSGMNVSWTQYPGGGDDLLKDREGMDDLVEFIHTQIFDPVAKSHSLKRSSSVEHSPRLGTFPVFLTEKN